MDSGKVQKKLKEKWEENSSIVNISQSNIKNEQLSSVLFSSFLRLPDSWLILGAVRYFRKPFKSPLQLNKELCLYLPNSLQMFI